MTPAQFLNTFIKHPNTCHNPYKHQTRLHETTRNAAHAKETFQEQFPCAAHIATAIGTLAATATNPNLKTRPLIGFATYAQPPLQVQAQTQATRLQAQAQAHTLNLPSSFFHALHTNYPLTYTTNLVPSWQLKTTL